MNGGCLNSAGYACRSTHVCLTYARSWRVDEQRARRSPTGGHRRQECTVEVTTICEVMRRVDVDLDLCRARMLLSRHQGLLLLSFDQQADIGVYPVLKLYLPHRHKLFALDSEVLLPLMEKPVVLTVPQVHIIILLPPNMCIITCCRCLRALD